MVVTTLTRNREADFALDLLERGRQAAAKHDGSQWELGDLAIEVDPTGKGSTLTAYAEAIGVARSDLSKYRSTASAYDAVLRSTALSWYHHHLVRNEPNRMDWLRKAEDLGWPAAQLRKEAFPPKEKEPEAAGTELSNLVLKAFNEAIKASRKAHIPYAAFKEAVNIYFEHYEAMNGTQGTGPLTVTSTARRRTRKTKS